MHSKLAHVSYHYLASACVSIFMRLSDLSGLLWFGNPMNQVCGYSPLKFSSYLWCCINVNKIRGEPGMTVQCEQLAHGCVSL